MNHRLGRSRCLSTANNKLECEKTHEKTKVRRFRFASVYVSFVARFLCFPPQGNRTRPRGWAGPWLLFSLMTWNPAHEPSRCRSGTSLGPVAAAVLDCGSVLGLITVEKLLTTPQRTSLISRATPGGRPLVGRMMKLVPLSFFPL